MRLGLAEGVPKGSFHGSLLIVLAAATVGHNWHLPGINTRVKYTGNYSRPTTGHRRHGNAAHVQGNIIPIDTLALGEDSFGWSCDCRLPIFELFCDVGHRGCNRNHCDNGNGTCFCWHTGVSY